jgi:iron complex transport system ATP-binding protein
VTTVEMHDVSVAYNGSRVLRGLSITVASGSWVCLIGPNGSGKTTALRAIAGMVAHTGEIRLGASAPGDLSRREIARRVAMVPQIPVIPDGMTVADYVLMGRTPYIPYLGAEKKRDIEITNAVLQQLDLSSLAHRAMRSLSGGELQRAVLARALVQEAPVLLLDEPTTGLDVGHQQQVLELVDGLRRERELTVVSSMHDLTVAGQFADYLVLLSEGEAVAAGEARSVLTEERIRKHYGASVRVFLDEGGGVVVIPVRAR